MEEKKEEYYIRIGASLWNLLNEINKEWGKKNGFKLSMYEIGELLSKKIENVGGVKI